ncbi:phage tail tape measure protein [Pseudoclavibacter sp. JSM 162008]|uniref:phage tail tape measure protein n=1 Tax=Pseudoclavibacter sp. JSM 162008 TaxID=3229855 RepID=UPI00352642F2
MGKSVLVTLGMNAAGYLAGARSAHQATRELAEGQENLAQRVQMQEQAMTQLGGVMMGTGAIFTAFVAGSVIAASNFESAMSSVQSATMAPVEQMGVLRDAALEAGQATSFTATEAAGGIEELGKAGVSTADILGGALSGSLDLAAAGELSVADAAEQAATTLSQFKLAGDQATHVADLLAAGAGKAQGSVGDLGQALNQSGLVASQMGLSVEETVGSLTAFAGAGLLGSDAGTSFRTMLMRLTNPTGEAADKLAELGIETRDANGEFIGMAGLAGQLQEKMQGLTPAARDAAMAIIFGQDAIRAANVLYAEGEEGISDWITKVDDSGYAAEVAAARLDNLGGDVEELGGAWETAMIRIGAGAQGPLREVVQVLTEVVNTVGDADPAMQGFILTAAAVAGGVLLIGGAGLVIIPQVAATSAALTTLGITAASTKTALLSLATSPVVTGLLAVGLAVATIGSELAEANLDAEEMTSALKNSTSNADLFAAAAKRSKGAFGDFVEWAVGADWDMEKGVEQLQDLSGTLDEISAKQGNTDWGEAGIRGASMVLKDLGAELANLDPEAAAQTFQRMGREAKLSEDQMVTLLDTMPAYRDALLEQTAGLGIVDGALDTHEEKLALVNFALEGGEQPAADYSEALAGQATNADDAAGAISALAEELSNYNSILYDSLNAEMDYYASVDQAKAGLEELNEQLKEGETLVDGMTGELNLQSEAGRNAMQSLMDVGQSTRDYAADLWETTGSAEQMQAALQQGWDEVYNLGTQMGLSEEQAKAYADQLVGVPSEVSTQIYNTAAEASRGVDGYTHLLGQIPGSVMTRISSDTVGAQATIDTFINANNGRTITIYTNSASGTQ